MDAGFINLTPENLDGEHLCCIIRSKKAHPGVEAKRQWLADRLKEGHIFRKLDAKEKETAFIEYAPLELPGFRSPVTIISISTASGLPAASREKELARL